MRWRGLRRGGTTAFAVVCLALAATGCGAHRDAGHQGHGPAAHSAASATPAPAAATIDSGQFTVTDAGPTVTRKVSPAAPIRAHVPGVGLVTAPAGTFTSAGTVHLIPQSATFGSAVPFHADGAGLDVTFDHTALNGPLTIQFDTQTPTQRNRAPVFAHHLDNGTWQITPARTDTAGRYLLSASSFSVHLPGWVDISYAWHWWGHHLASAGHYTLAKLGSAVAGRTSPLTCAGKPSWFSLGPGSVTTQVWVCVRINHTRSGPVAELQIKSNRGVTEQITVPGRPSYVWVQNQSWQQRTAIGRALGFNPNRTVLLPPGATMTIGYPRTATDQHLTAAISADSVYAVADTLIRAALKLAGEFSPDTAAAADLLCLGNVHESLSGGVHVGPSDLRVALDCLGDKAKDFLMDPAHPTALAKRLGEGSAGAAALRGLGKGLGGLGWLVDAWPVAQESVGNFTDAVTTAITGHPNLVEYYITGQGTPTPSTRPHQPSQHAAPPPADATAHVHLARGSAHANGYRYAVTLSGFPAHARIRVTCYDSVSPGGFYSFTVTTSAAGAADTSSQCYSADGPDHWVRAGGLTSNHVTWTAHRTLQPPAPPTSPSAPAPAPSGHRETAGSVAHTWTNYTNAGGAEGPAIDRYQSVRISCRRHGFKVADGNTWWYRIASSPWQDRYYVSADAFYNNGSTSGSLHGTPFVDPAIPQC